MRPAKVQANNWTELSVALFAAMLLFVLCGVQPSRADVETVEVPPLDAPVCEPVESPAVASFEPLDAPLDEESDRLARFEGALREIAAFDGYDLDELLSDRDPTVDLRELARVLLAVSDDVELDPILLALVAWNESKFAPAAIGGDEDGEWCGIGQILAADRGSATATFPVYPERPSCLQAIEDWRSSLAWSAALLASTVERPECDGSPCLLYYWGEGEAAGRNERRIWRRANTLRTRGVWE